MRLKASHRRQLMMWIADGRQSDEINALADQLDDPFSVTRQQVDYYRKIAKVDYAAITRANKMDALTEGLALRSERVNRLQTLAALMEVDLFGGLMWTDQVKGVGAGTAAEVVDYEEFNRGEIEQYRGVLDDIAKEMGERKQTLAGDLVVRAPALEAILERVYNKSA
jgi:hypothetical protein